MGGGSSLTDAAANTGNGGDGAYAVEYAARGGSGVVIIRYKVYNL